MTTIQIKGMNCGHCIASVKKALEEIDGVSDVQVDLDSGEASFQGNVEKETITSTIESIGFELVQAE